MLAHADQGIRAALQLITTSQSKIEELVSFKSYRECEEGNNIDLHYDILDALNSAMCNCSSIRMQIAVPLRKYLLIADKEKNIEKEEKEEKEEITDSDQENLLNAFSESEKIMEDSKTFFEGVTNEKNSNKEIGIEGEFLFIPDFSGETKEEDNSSEEDSSEETKED